LFYETGLLKKDRESKTKSALNPEIISSPAPDLFRKKRNDFRFPGFFFVIFKPELEIDLKWVFGQAENPVDYFDNSIYTDAERKCKTINN
jgi:hypothetical protein